jgi:hypothetical protein
MNRLFLSICSILFLFFSVSKAQATSIDLILVGYEDEKDYEDNPTCKLEFTFGNNSWGTLYGLSIETEVYDDRGDKMDDYGFSSKIEAFELFSDIKSIKVGNAATFKSLHLKGKCQYVQDIYLKKVEPEKCNIRMMPEEADCLTIVNPVSRIDHVNLINEFSSVQSSNSVSESNTTNESSIEPLYYASEFDVFDDLIYDGDVSIKKTLGTNTGREIQIDDLYIWSFDDTKYTKGGTLQLINDDSMGTQSRISCVVDAKTGDEFMVNRVRQSLQIIGRIKSYDDFSGLIIEPCIVLNSIQ